MMAGGSMHTGRVDNDILFRYLDVIDPFFQIYLANRRQWTKIVTYIQRISPASADGSFSLKVSGNYTVKGEHASRISAPEPVLQALEQLGFLSELSIDPENSVSFSFRDAQIRAWLRDVGSVLELYVYKACSRTCAPAPLWTGMATAGRTPSPMSSTSCVRGASPRSSSAVKPVTQRPKR